MRPYSRDTWLSDPDPLHAGGGSSMEGDFRLDQWLIQPQLNSIVSPDDTAMQLEPKVMEALESALRSGARMVNGLFSLPLPSQRPRLGTLGRTSMVDPSDVDSAGSLRPVSIGTSGLELSLPLRVGVDFGVLTHVGKVRENNEDHHLVARLGRIFEPLETNVPPDAFPPYLGELGYALVVADGMGGAAAGEVASRMAISLFINLVIETGKWGRRIDEREARAVMERITEYYTAIHTRLTEQAEAEPALSGMGTTFTMAYNLSSDLFVGHVGDSRAYLFREGRLHRLTRDHTLAQQLADRGDIPLEAVAKHRYRHILTNVLGGQSWPLETELQHFQLADRDRMLVCSDGLSEMVEDAAIEGVLRRIENPREACGELVDLALEAGGKDNITVIVARYSFACKP